MTCASHASSNLVYATSANDAVGMPLVLSIFGNRAHVCATMRDDAQAAGLHVRDVSGLEAILDGKERALGDVVLVDCPHVDGTALAALARLDMRAANSGARLIVSTSVEALDDVFACLDQSSPQLLVDPTRADRVVALGRVLAQFPSLGVRELADEDRLMLLRLTEQVSQIAERLDTLNTDSVSGDQQVGAGTFRFESPRKDFTSQPQSHGDRLVRQPRPALPDPRMVRQIIRHRQLRTRFFEGDIFADPAWDMLLDLTAARAEHLRVSVTSLCIASGVPPTTALRWIGQMTEAGLFERVEDDTDRRRAFIALSEKAADAMARYFAELGKASAKLV